MKVEIADALLHRPGVLFLDEPTLGLDITMQRRIRSFIGEYNRRHGATVLLTSHYMADVQALCKRVIVIHHGRILFDGDLTALSDRFASHKTITVQFEAAGEIVDLSHFGEASHTGEDTVTLKVARTDVARVTARLLSEYSVADLTIEDPAIDDVIEQVFADGSAEGTD